MKKILITGSSGFIGFHLVSHLKNLNYEVFTADKSENIDLSIQENVKKLPDVDIVVHLAAYNGTKNFYEKPLDVIRDSLLPTQYLIDRYAGKIERFIFTGTCESYAGAVDLFNWQVPTNEKVPLVVPDVLNPRWSYGGSKIVNELQIVSAYNQLNQNYTIIRYHNVYGPRQKEHFIPEFYERARKGNLTLNGWENTRSFMYIDDAIRATTNIIESDKCVNQIINVGVNDEKSIKEIALMILKEANIHGELILNQAPEGSVKKRCPDISKMNSLIDFSPSISLSEGIKKTLELL
jgi:UDP-glucose 4-epimerase